MLRNTEYAWGAVSRGLHWLLAILILAQLVLGRVADEVDLSPLKLDLFVWHKSIGVTVLLFVVVRIGWRFANPTPKTVAPAHRIIVTLAKLGHGILYLLMVLVPVSGWVVSDTSRIPFRAFWQVPVPDLMAANRSVNDIAEDVHEALTTTLAIVVSAHVVAALVHHFWWRDETLARMLPIAKRGGI